MVINHLLNGMILQVPVRSYKYGYNSTSGREIITPGEALYLHKLL